ncbi:MAG: UDP-3-O-acyl-N-acetylglucosamine deacetylase, partial [Candidatus Omnitrophica bacterium]|nr:UDP-3-O-acyl-N-acetylglucosamine deacetylase [Candidatus Omnitrophota bacterium]
MALATIRQNIIVRLIAATLVLALCCENAASANPDIVQNKSFSNTLQIPSRFSLLANPEQAYRLILECKLLEYIRAFDCSPEEINRRFHPILNNGVELDYRFDKAVYDEGSETTVVPTTISYDPYRWSYEIVIAADKTILDIRLTAPLPRTAPETSNNGSVTQIIKDKYNIGHIKSVKKEKTKTGREIYIIDSVQGKFLFTTIWEGYPPEQIDLMKALIDHLVNSGFGEEYFAPEILVSRNNKNYVSFNNRYYYLRRYTESGTALDISAPTSFYTEINIRQLKSAARMLAHYHKAIEDFWIQNHERFATIRALTKRATPLRQKLESLISGGEKDELILEIDREDIAGKIDRLKASFRDLYHRLPKISIHGDFQPMNILFKGDEAVGILDFEHVKNDVRLVDFIAGILELEKGRDPKIDEDRIKIFLDEYIKHNTLSVEEFESISVMLKLNYLNRVSAAVTDYHEKLKESKEYRDYIQACLLHIKSIDKFDWGGLIRSVKVRYILSYADWNEQVDFLKKEFKNKDALEALKSVIAVMMSSTYISGEVKVLTRAEKMRFFSKAISLAIRGQEGKAREEFLRRLDLELLEKPERFEPEAILLCRSFLNIAMAKVGKGTKVSTVISCEGEQDAIRIRDGGSVNGENDYIGDDDFFRTRIEQIKDLYAVNENFNWELILIGDGDDRRHNDTTKQEKTIDIARKIAEDEYGDLYKEGKIRILELSDRQKKEINSQKGGAICLGMRNALNNGADYVFFINAISAYHASQEGLLLQELLYGADMAIASRKTEGAISKRSWLREIKSVVYNKYLRIALPWTRGFSDTQAGFKAFRRESLETVLPVSQSGDFDKNFDYGLSFDTDLISRYRILNKGIIQVPVVRISFPKRISRADSPLKIIKMVWGILKQRFIFLKKFKKWIEEKRAQNGEDYFDIKDTDKETYSYRIFPEENTIRIEGISLHQGKRSVVIIRKNDRHTNNYISKSVPVTLEPAIHDIVGYSALELGKSEVSTMEHLASAIKATGLTGLDICLYGAGFPILNGDALGWINIFEEAGWVNNPSSMHRSSYRIQNPIILLRKRNVLRALRYAFRKFRRSGNLIKFIVYTFRIFFPKAGYDVSPVKNIVLPLENGSIYPEYIFVLTLPNISNDSRSANFRYEGYESYKQSAGKSKTFIPVPVWERQQEGMFKGALPGRNIHTLFTHKKDRRNRWTAELHQPNEPAMHKIMDMIGDVYLTESEMGERLDVKGLFVGVGSGHRDNIEIGSMIKKSVDRAKKGTGMPLMANITPYGTLEYLDYDAKFVLKELKRLHKKGYIEDHLYSKIKTRLEATHNTPLPLKLSLPELIIFVFSKLSHALNGVFGIPVRLNQERADHIKNELEAAGAGKVMFFDKTSARKGLSVTTPDKTVYI